jgi:hypothetical protein
LSLQGLDQGGASGRIEGTSVVNEVIRVDSSQDLLPPLLIQELGLQGALRKQGLEKELAAEVERLQGELRARLKRLAEDLGDGQES